MANRLDRKNVNLIYGQRLQREEGDEVVLGKIHQGLQTFGLQLKDEYKRATKTSRSSLKKSLANTEAPI